MNIFKLFRIRSLLQMLMKKYILFLFLFNIFTQAFSQDIRYENYIYQRNIKTVIFHKLGSDFAYPIIELNSDSQIQLKFDDSDNEIKDFNYTIIHCNSDWQPSDLSPIEYIEGFVENQISDYESSFNTLILYNHYKLTFPNDDIKPTVSGNYILLVYEDFDRERIVLTRRFWVNEKKIHIKAEVKRSTLVSSISKSQEITFDISHNFIQYPIDNLKVFIAQNNRQDNMLQNLQPAFIQGNKLIYNNPADLIFSGGNEYRYFNIKNTKYVTERVSSIHYENPYYYFRIVTDKNEAYLPYSYHQDLNGERLITADNTEDSDIESDYVFAEFILKRNTELLSGNFYVFGAISDWRLSENNKMIYDKKKKAYTLRLFLKQGYYNYEYAFAETKESEIDNTIIEGSHYETENDYIIYVYYREPGSVYDKLIGVKFANSMKRL